MSFYSFQMNSKYVPLEHRMKYITSELYKINRYRGVTLCVQIVWNYTKLNYQRKPYITIYCSTTDNVYVFILPSIPITKKILWSNDQKILHDVYVFKWNLAKEWIYKYISRVSYAYLLFDNNLYISLLTFKLGCIYLTPSSCA